jgi:enediyne biosynthesis protein E4
MNVSQASLIGRHAESGMGVVAADFDDDGDIDIFVANDSMRNFLYLNDGQGQVRGSC